MTNDLIEAEFEIMWNLIDLGSDLIEIELTHTIGEALAETEPKVDWRKEGF